tara:strand:+ start:906 stop:1103 length:198 start_codon:yes stop_codon:yes gene_type:complete
MDTINMLDNYTEYDITKMIEVYEKYKKQKEYRRNYYKNKYNNDEIFRNKKKLENRLYMRSKRSNM